MASLMEKTKDLGTFAWNDLRQAIIRADKSGEYKDFEQAMKEVRATERKMKAVRAHVRANMRKTKKAFQDACSHEKKVDTRVRQSYGEQDGVDGRRIVEFQACTNCSKEFDLREKVSS
jgi:hypothetical protein